MNIHVQFGFNHICSFWEEGISTFSHRVITVGVYSPLLFTETNSWIAPFFYSSKPLSKKSLNHTFWNNMWISKSIIIVIYYLNTKIFSPQTSSFLLFELVHQYVLYKWGSPIPFPTGGACVLSVIRFQDGGRRSAGGSVPKLEYDILRRNASTNVRKTYLIERYILHWKPKHTIYVRYFSILLYLLNVQVAPTENKTSLKLWWRISLNDECAFVTGFRDKTRRICHI